MHCEKQLKIDSSMSSASYFPTALPFTNMVIVHCDWNSVEFLYKPHDVQHRNEMWLLVLALKLMSHVESISFLLASFSIPKEFGKWCLCPL